MPTSGVSERIAGPSVAGEPDREARVLVPDYSCSDTLHDLVDAATALLGIHGAAASCAYEGRLVFVAASRDDVRALEQLQERDQQGPGPESFRTCRPVVVADLAVAAPLWSELGQAVAVTPIVSVACVPLMLDGTCLGALDLYRTRTGDWSPDEVQGAEVLSALATSHLSFRSRVRRARLSAEQLHGVLGARMRIEQATGVLARERGVSKEQAFQMLRAHARRHRASVREVAHAIVVLGLRPCHPGAWPP